MQRRARAGSNRARRKNGRRLDPRRRFLQLLPLRTPAKERLCPSSTVGSFPDLRAATSFKKAAGRSIRAGAGPDDGGTGARRRRTPPRRADGEGDPIRSALLAAKPRRDPQPPADVLESDLHRSASRHRRSSCSTCGVPARQPRLVRASDRGDPPAAKGEHKRRSGKHARCGMRTRFTVARRASKTAWREAA